MIAKVLPNNTLRRNGEIFEAGQEVDIDESEIVALEGVVEVSEDGSDKVEVNVKVEEKPTKPTKAQLKERAAELGLAVPARATNEEIQAMIDEAEAQDANKSNENEDQNSQSDDSASDEKEASNKEEGSSDEEKASESEKTE